MKKRIIAMVTFLVLMFAFCSVALAAGGVQLYDYGPITHRIDFGPLDKSTAASWLSGSDHNSSVSFNNASLTRYQKSRVITEDGIAMSDEKTVNSGGSGQFSSIYSAYKSVEHTYLRVRNPYYGTSNASPMSTIGNFQMIF